jgi:hypothetical protein
VLCPAGPFAAAARIRAAVSLAASRYARHARTWLSALATGAIKIIRDAAKAVIGQWSGRSEQRCGVSVTAWTFVTASDHSDSAALELPDGAGQAGLANMA